MTELSSRQTFALYGLVVTFVFVAFVLGLLIGTGTVEREEVRPASLSYEQLEDLEAPLDFYDELSKPVKDSIWNEPVVILEKGSKITTAPAVAGEVKETKPVEENGRERFTIQVAAHSTREEADQLLLRLEPKGFDGSVREPDKGIGTKYYRVWVGEFSSIAEAEVTAARLKEAGFHTYIRRTH